MFKILILQHYYQVSDDAMAFQLGTFKKKSHKLWIWKAVCGIEGRPIDWECGDRDQATLKRLVERLEAWNPLFYRTDDWPGFPALLPPKRFHPGKDGTVTIKQNNGRQRHGQPLYPAFRCCSRQQNICL